MFGISDKNSEDIGAIFFDAKHLTDIWIYIVVSGVVNSKWDQVEVQDRLVYLNDGKGHFFKTVNSCLRMAI